MDRNRTQDIDDYKRALRICGELLSQRDYSEKKLREKLLSREVPPDAADSAIEEMKNAHYLDDARYASSFIMAHLHNRSMLRIRNDLKERGISDEVIADAVAGVDREEAAAGEMEQIRAALEKKKYIPGETDYATRQKIMASLYRKGFQPGLIRKAMDADEEF